MISYLGCDDAKSSRSSESKKYLCTKGTALQDIPHYSPESNETVDRT
jgi:hypothetical protein